MKPHNLEFKLLNQYHELEDLVYGHGPEFLNQRHRPDKWSIHENLAHLGRYQEVFEDRINRILAEKQPVFDRYRAEDDPKFSAWVSKNSQSIIEETGKHREKLAIDILGILKTQPTVAGIHPKLGLLTIEEWVHFFLLHESHHIYTIFWLVREFI